MTSRLPYDPTNPPADPPPGADPLLWQLAWQVFCDHTGVEGGFCSICRPLEPWPCEPIELAAQTLAYAAGVAPMPDLIRQPVG